jgi:hypothetical protein
LSDRKLAMLDCETTLIADGKRPRTRLWGLAVDGESYRWWPTTAGLLRYLRGRRGPLLMLHHHDFDALQLLVDGAPLMVYRIRGARVLRSKLYRHTLGNSYALFPSSLAAILHATGRSKLPLGCKRHDGLLSRALSGDSRALSSYDRIAEKCELCKAALLARNESDCVEGLAAIMELARRWEGIFGVDPLTKTTAAGVAMAAAKLVAGPMPIDTSHRDAYRGGRSEAFRIGAVGPVSVFDVCSSYPASIADAPERDELLDATVHVPDDERIPPVFDASRTDSLLFPVGKVRTWIYESHAQALGLDVRRVHERYPVDLSWLHELGPHVRRWYARRAASSEEGERYPIKTTLNSLYGRTGMKPERQVISYEDRSPSGDCSFFPIKGGRFVVFRAVRVPDDRHHANYPIASYITGGGRTRLLVGMRQIEDGGGTVHYCDTDSALAGGDAAPSPLGTGLGEWKREEGGELTIRTIKDYRLERPSGPLDKRKGGAGGYEWTLRRALAGRGAGWVRKERLTPYGKRLVSPDGSTVAFTAGRYG